ncbi:patched family protein [Ancylostoma ceylanicum]|uniref:Patched family protein n=1 Tax=Ancylostoma ceylanicum TaxID=53326 RepID=A0A0D6LJT8_9BILA|nr:patched family protein [Ancylostoma ceylanicum]
MSHKEDKAPLSSTMGEHKNISPHSILKKPKAKCDESLVGRKPKSSKGFFRRWGTLIGQFPLAFLMSGLILCSLSCGMVKLHLRDNVRDGYTPRTSRSRVETDLYREFLGSEGECIVFACHVHVFFIIHVSGDPAMTTVLMLAKDNGSMHRLDYLREAVQTMVHILEQLNAAAPDGSTVGYYDFCGHYCDSNVPVEYFFQALEHKTLNPGSTTIQLTYPSAELWGFKLPLERNFYGVRTADHYNITNIEYVKLISLSFMAEVKTATDTERLGAWELALFDFCSRYTSNSSNILEILAIGAEIVDTEMNKDAQRMTPYFVTGFLIMFCFVCITVCASSLYFDHLRWNTVWMTRFSPCTPGFVNQCDTLPLQDWGKSSKRISIFCFGCAVALGFAYIYNVIIFCPVLYFCSLEETEKVQKEDYLRKKGKRFFRAILHGYSRVISDYRVALGLFTVTLVYWYFGAMGTMSITAKLDTGKILPKDTPIRRPNRLMEDIVWREYYPVTIIVNNPVDIRGADELTEIYSFVDEFEQLPTCRGPNFTLFWLRDYSDYARDTRDFWALAFLFNDEEHPEKDLDYNKLPGFLNSTLYKHHASFLNLDYSQEYPRLNASVWNVNSMYVDQMLSLKPLAWKTCLCTLFCMAIVCTIFVQNPISIMMAVSAIASISLGVVGYLSFWHLDLDPVTLCAVLISIGMAVDYVAHTSYHYQFSYREIIQEGHEMHIGLTTPYDRIRNTLTKVAWPMSQAGTSTVICILPIALLQNYIPLVFVKTFILVVVWGLLHGLVLLPAFLSQEAQHGAVVYGAIHRAEDQVFNPPLDHGTSGGTCQLWKRRDAITEEASIF